MRNFMLGLVLALTTAFGFFAMSSSVQAKEASVYHGFVKDSYYLGRGGTPATFEQVANNPLAVFRSEVAYVNLREHIGNYLGKSLSDADFKTLLRSDNIRLISCTGRITTAGVTDSGHFGWRERGCYAGEMLIQVRLLDGRWVTVASQGCYNPVRGEVPSLPPVPVASSSPPPKKVVCRTVYAQRQTQATDGLYLQAVYLPNCCCPPKYYQALYLPGSSPDTMTTAIQVCS